MDFLGIGLPEVIAIVLLLFLVLGPQDLVKLGSSLGKTLRGIRQSGVWQSFQEARQQLRHLPDELARQAGAEQISELRDELKEEQAKLKKLDEQLLAWTRAPEPLSQKKKPASETTEKSSEGQ
ncbi:MAG: twin-arginine translocase TatA/TatE family subunit [Anaerolineales bacterium]